MTMLKQANSIYLKRIEYGSMVSVVRITGKHYLRIDYDTEYDEKCKIENLVLTSPTCEIISEWIKDSKAGAAITLTQEEFMTELIQAQSKLTAIAA